MPQSYYTQVDIPKALRNGRTGRSRAKDNYRPTKDHIVGMLAGSMMGNGQIARQSLSLLKKMQDSVWTLEGGQVVDHSTLVLRFKLNGVEYTLEANPSSGGLKKISPRP